MNGLNKKETSCCKATRCLENEELMSFKETLGCSWQVIEQHHLHKEFTFSSFKEALSFVNKVGELAELAHHHPHFSINYDKVIITLWTHTANGLTKKDFVLASQIESTYASFKAAL